MALFRYDGRVKPSLHPNVPLVAVALLAGAWFASFSYTFKMPLIYQLLAFDMQAYAPLETFQLIRFGLMILALLMVLWPRKDSSPVKWGIITLLVMMVYLLSDNLFPDLANHGMMMWFLALGSLIASFCYFIRGKWLQAVTHTDYLPLMRAALLIMYFFGTFHKINTDFLLPTGCWAKFYNGLPLMPEALKDPSIALYLGGYGTVILEALAMIGLLFPATKYYAMLLGMFFHFMIGVTWNQNIAHFSAFAVALHMSFLSTDAIPRFKQSWLWCKVLNVRGYGAYSLRGLVLLFIGVSVLLSYAWLNGWQHRTDYPTVPYEGFYIDLMWWVYGVPLLLFVAFFGGTQETRHKPFLLARMWPANLATLLFFLNSTISYIGLAAHADLGMFSNLRTEWGKTNHYIIRKPLNIFPYLNQSYYVKVIASSNPRVDWWKNRKGWTHAFNIQREFHVLRYDNINQPYWVDVEYPDGRKERVYSDNEHHILTKEPTWAIRHYLRYHQFTQEEPIRCSSR